MANTGRHRTNVATLFDVFCEVAAPDAAATGKPTIVQKYPEDFNDAAILDSVRLFAFPAGADIDGVDTVQLFVFALTDVHRLHTYGFCRYTPRTNTCICLLTGYQWTNVFFTLLNHISVVINNGTQEDLDSLLTRIYHTDTPAVGDRLGFEVGKHRVTVDIPDLTRLPTLKDDKFMLEFYNGVTSRQMMSVYASLLKERRILFTGRKLSQVSSCVIAASTLLYPMTWWHIFLPIIPAERRDMISAPMPYIIGIPKQLLDAQTMKELGDVMIVDLDERSLQASHDDFAALPSEVQSHLRSALKTGVDMGDALSRVFLRATLTLFGLYRVGLVRDEQTTVVSWDKDKFLAEQRPQYQGYLASLLGHDGAQYLEQFIHHRLIALNTGCPINDEFEKEAASFDAKIKSQTMNTEALQQAVSTVRENANDVIGALKDKVQSIQIREKFGKLTAREIRKSRSGKRAARKASSHMTKSVERGPNGAFQPLSFENIQWSSEQDGPQSSEEDEDSLEGEGAAGAIGDLIDLGDTPTKESPPRPPPAPHSGRASAPIDFDDLLAQPSRVAPPQHQPPSLPRPALARTSLPAPAPTQPYTNPFYNMQHVRQPPLPLLPPASPSMLGGGFPSVPSSLPPPLPIRTAPLTLPPQHNQRPQPSSKPTTWETFD